MSSMKYRISSIVLLFMLLISFSAYAINFTPEDTYNSVVVVYTETGVGSGFYVKENIIITNAHVVGYNKKVAVNLYDGTTIKGNVIKIDNEKDLALIKVDKTITPLSINSEDLSIGQEVYAIGAPKDMPYTMTKGIISALDRKIGQNIYIQIDASVNSGNSGGPLVDDNGNVIGIITLKASDAEGIGFAINTKDINNFIEGVETSEHQDSSETEKEENDVLPNENNDKNNEVQKMLMAENDGLKIALCISVIVNIIFGLLYFHILLKKRSKKEKDEFDFEIEIEE